MAKNTIDGLKRFFRIDVRSIDGQPKVVPTSQKKDAKGNYKTSVVKFPSDLQKYQDWYFNQVLDNSQSLAQRINRYKDVDYMRYNEPIISYAIELYGNEASQADIQDNIFTFKTKDKKFTNYLYDLIYNKWNIDQNWIKEISCNLASYGDSFMINCVDDKDGITEFVPIDPYLLKERIELNLSKVRFTDQQMDYQSYIDFASKRDTRMQALVDMMQDNIDVAKYFKSYLFGFSVDPDITLPPWGVTHFRLFSNKSEFYPYGRSLFINAISPYRQLQASKNLMVMARASKFPKELFTIETDESMTEIEKWDAVNSARQEFLNLAQSYSDKEQNGVGTQMWLPSGLLSHELIENNMRLEDIADVELLEESLVRATGVPFDYIVQRQGGYTSGIALTMQSKPFARKVYTIQNAILKQIAQNIRIHLLITKEFDYDQDFEVYMNFPNVEDSRDRIGIKNDTLRLAKDVIDNLTTSLGLDRDEALPIDIVKDIFAKYSFIEMEDLNEWEKIFKKDRAENDSLVESKRIKEKYKKRIDALTEEVVAEVYFESKNRLKMLEGVTGQKHFLNSNAITKEEKTILEALKTKNTTKLEEGESPNMFKHKIFNTED